MTRPLARLLVAAALLSALGAIAAAAADWPQWRGPTRDGVWTEDGLIERFAAPQIPVKWRRPIGAGYSGPTIAGGRVFVTDRTTEPGQRESVHAFDAETGRPLWTYSYECFYLGIQYAAGPRAAVSLDEGRAYSLGAMGHLHCFNAETGEVVWRHDANSEYKIQMPTWGIAAAPLIEGELLIVHLGGERGASVVAFDKRTGEERWRALDDPPSYVAPIVIEQAGQRVLVVRTANRVVGLDPTTGALHWQHPYPAAQVVIAVPTPVFDRANNRMFFTSFYDGSLMLRIEPNRLAVSPLWQRKGQNEINTDALHSIISTPLILGDHVYGCDSYGQLRCLDANTGERVWSSQDAVPEARWSTIHFVQNGERVWMFNERGELIISRLSPRGFEEISRAKLIEPTREQLNQRGGVCWSHPGYANRHVFARNDAEIVCASLAAP